MYLNSLLFRTKWRVILVFLSSTSLTWNVFPTLAPPTLSKFKRQGFTQTRKFAYSVVCFMGNEAKYGELSIPLEKKVQLLRALEEAV